MLIEIFGRMMKREKEKMGGREAAYMHRGKNEESSRYFSEAIFQKESQRYPTFQGINKPQQGTWNI